MKVIITGHMGPGTLEAKVIPISRVERITDIIFIRKSAAQPTNKTIYVKPFLIKTLSPLHIIITPLTLWYNILKYKPEIIIGYHIIPYGFFAAFIGLFTKTSFIVAQTGLKIQEDSEDKFLNKILYYIFKKSLRVNCPGNSSMHFWQNKYPEIANKFHVLHSTIDTEFYKPDIEFEKKYNFIFLGRLAKVKQVDLIIEAFHLLLNSSYTKSNLSFVIVGDGPERDYLGALVKKLNLESNIIFKGFISNPKTILLQSKFIVMSSKTEGLPTAMMQAMSCQLIPITNIVGNIGDLVEDNKTGIVHDGSVFDLSKKMKQALILDEYQTTVLRKNAREKIEKHHSYDYAYTQWDKFFTTQMSKK
jgi:glycosyltransferase involved in cell wall biosynthesis